eukprot:jgi/Tetstr1/455496/TSEL_042325.t1
MRPQPQPQTPYHVPCALPDPFLSDRLTFLEASVDVCDVLSSIPNDRLTPAERCNLVMGRDMKGSVPPIGIGSVLVSCPSRSNLGASASAIIWLSQMPRRPHIGAAAHVVGQAVTFLRAQHANMSDAGAFLSEPSGVSSPHSLYLVGASSTHQALATPVLAPAAGANVSAPMWAVELRAAHTRVVDECGDAVL